MQAQRLHFAASAVTFGLVDARWVGLQAGQERVLEVFGVGAGSAALVASTAVSVAPGAS
jgi:hypothetical protein